MSCEDFRRGVGRFAVITTCCPTFADPSQGYKTEHFWLEYPHRQMTLELQQTIILAAKIEKPRKDFKELVAHVSGSGAMAMRVGALLVYRAEGGSTSSLCGSSGGVTPFT
jgi:hypothetical protein